MKYKMLLSLLLGLSVQIFSQNGATSVGMSKEFNQLASGAGGRAVNTSAFQTYSSGDIEGSQFFLPGWQDGEVALNDKQLFNDGLVLVYDKVRQELFIRQKNANVVLLGEKEKINSFVLRDGTKSYNFINSGKFGIDNPEVFYEVLIDNHNDSLKYSLFKLNSCKLVKADKTNMMKMREGQVDDAFVDHYTYYIVKGAGIIQEVALKTKAVKKILTSYDMNADKYSGNHPGAVNEDYLITLVTYMSNHTK